MATPACLTGPGPLNVERVALLGTTLCVWAHPDDENYPTGGLLLSCGARENAWFASPPPAVRPGPAGGRSSPAYPARGRPAADHERRCVIVGSVGGPVTR
jgi:hypothetical protein